jgi:DNA-binding transcriptional LysR family regulator
MIDRYLMRYFLAVVDCGTFTRAAHQVNVSQPTLSAGIAKLERLLGIKLFKRTSQRIELTEAGVRFMPHARRIEAEFHQAEAAVHEVQPLREIRIGYLSTFPGSEMGGFVSQASDLGVRIELVEGSARTLLQTVVRNRVDVALTILREVPRGMSCEPLREEGYSLALPTDHPLAEEEEIPAEALANNPMIVRRNCEVLSETSRHFTERGVRPYFSFRTTNDDRALQLVRAGLGITLMPDCYHLDGVARPRLAGFTAKRRLGLLWAGDKYPASHQHNAVIASLRRQFSG